MQPIPKLAEKLAIEYGELQEAVEQWDEIPDIIYYLSCLCLQVDAELQERGVTWEQSKAATLAKYAMRATQPKDIEAERQAIFAAIEN